MGGGQAKEANIGGVCDRSRLLYAVGNRCSSSWCMVGVNWLDMLGCCCCCCWAGLVLL